MREHRPSRGTAVRAAEPTEHNQLFLTAIREQDAPAVKDLNVDSKMHIADNFLRLAALPTFVLDRLSRMQIAVDRILFGPDGTVNRMREAGPAGVTFVFCRGEK